LDLARLRDNCQVTSSAEMAGRVHVTLGPDGHEAVFTCSWLAPQALPDPDNRSEDAKRLWSAADFPAGPPAARWDDYLVSSTTRLASLRQLLSIGFMLLRGVPPRPRAVLDVAATLGYIRETNHGRLFDLRVGVTPAGLGLAGLPVGPHTAGPYRDPVPTLQLLYCVTNAADGEFGLLDGFAAAAQLRSEDPASFGCLTRTPATFGYSDATAELRATRPMIGTDPAGRIREIRYDSKSMQPMRPRRGASPDQAADDMREFYLAYRAFASVLLRPGLSVRFGLTPGDCIVVDNTRVLHSVAVSAESGRCHLQGCYADIDGAESTVAVLARPKSAAQPGG
jgi:gamma-butyrobetaine dioxygenase